MTVLTSQGRVLSNLVSRTEGQGSTGLKKPKMPKFSGNSDTNLIDWLLEYKVATQGQTDREIISLMAHYIADPEYFRRAVMEMSLDFRGTWEEFKLKVILASFKNKNGYEALLSTYNNYTPVVVLPGQYIELAQLLKNLSNLRDVLSQIRSNEFRSEGDFVRHFLTRIYTKAVRYYLTEKMITFHSHIDEELDLVPNHTIAQLKRACSMWGRVQDIPATSFNLVTGNTMAAATDQKPVGKFLKVRGKPDKEIRRSHRETSNTSTQIYNDDSSSGESSDEDVRDQPQKKRRSIKKPAEEESGILKNILNVVTGLSSVPTPTPPPYPPPQRQLPQPTYQQQSYNPQQQPSGQPGKPMLPQPYRTKNGSANCTFCRQPFGYTIPPVDHYVTCPLLTKNKRRCAHFREGCPETFPIPTTQRDDKKANVGKAYVQHLTVCKFHECRTCKLQGKPSQHSNLRCPEHTCTLCNQKGHQEYLCHEC